MPCLSRPSPRRRLHQDPHAERLTEQVGLFKPGGASDRILDVGARSIELVAVDLGEDSGIKTCTRNARLSPASARARSNKPAASRELPSSKLHRPSNRSASARSAAGAGRSISALENRCARARRRRR